MLWQAARLTGALSPMRQGFGFHSGSSTYNNQPVSDKIGGTPNLGFSLPLSLSPFLSLSNQYIKKLKMRIKSLLNMSDFTVYNVLLCIMPTPACFSTDSRV